MKAAVLAGLRCGACATDSTFLGMMLHIGGNVSSAFSLFAQGRSEWQLGSSKPTLVWQSGVDASFVANVVLLLVVSAAAGLAYTALISAGRATRLRAG